MSLCRQVPAEFLGTLAHELRNPLQTLAGVLYLVRDARPDERARALAIADRQVKLLTRLVDDLLDASRAAHGKLVLHKEPIDLRLVAADAVDAVRVELAARGHRLILELPRQPLCVEADCVRLGQVLFNLLGNAIKFTDPGGHITLSAERLDDHVALRVRDTGVGIAPHMLRHIFDPFVQDLRGEPDRRGLGVGLMVVRQLVELHGGSVEARSEGVGRGSEFVVRLPARPLARLRSNPLCDAGSQAPVP